jgi:hypothetical protein
MELKDKDVFLFRIPTQIKDHIFNSQLYDFSSHAGFVHMDEAGKGITLNLSLKKKAPSANPESGGKKKIGGSNDN